MFLISCGSGSQNAENSYLEKLKVFEDNKVRTLFPEEPERLPIEEDFVGSQVVSKRTYLVQNDTDSVVFMVVYLESEDQEMLETNDVINYFRETNMIGTFDTIVDRAPYFTIYKAVSNISERCYWAKFQSGGSSSTGMISLVVSEGAHVDSSMAMHFLENTEPSQAF